jgi:microsomal dipeptidase-like Zn-dependent dipeptidase
VIADLHAHYPIHLVPAARGKTLELITSARSRAQRLDRVRALLVAAAGRLSNYQSFSSGPRVSVPRLLEGDVGVVLSVLYSPFDEMDISVRYGSPPVARYMQVLMRQLDDVERDIDANFADVAAIAHSALELEAALALGKLALVHCVEGGFHLGDTPESVDRSVRLLAARGVAYITIAHLFWRQVATNTNAIPFLPDWAYDRLFPQPHVGLTELGKAAIRAMVAERVLIDLSHMSAYAVNDTLALLDQLDPERKLPVIASHVAYRFGRQKYNLDHETIERIAARGGVIGLILSEHQGADGLRRRRTQTLSDSLEVVSRHLGTIRAITGSHRHAAIGSDHDGFIKPTLAGLEDSSRLSLLEDALLERYGADDGALIASGNVLRLLREHWRGAAAV